MSIIVFLSCDVFRIGFFLVALAAYEQLLDSASWFCKFFDIRVDMGGELVCSRGVARKPGDGGEVSLLGDGVADEDNEPTDGDDADDEPTNGDGAADDPDNELALGERERAETENTEIPAVGTIDTSRGREPA